jgi:hypothetical protein
MTSNPQTERDLNAPNRQAVKYGHEFRGIRQGESLCCRVPAGI